MSSFSFAGNRAIYAGLRIGTALLTGALSYLYYKYWKRDVIPIKWRRVGTLEQINLYPIKSCAPLQLPTESVFLCEVLGLSHKGIRDRGLMLINENFEVVTSSIYSKLVSVHTKVEKTNLVAYAKDMPNFVVNFDNLADKKSCRSIQVTFRGAKLDVIRCGRKYDKFFSRLILNSNWGLHLVYYPKPKKDLASSFMLINLASVDDLNNSLPDISIDPMQFRGNFHLKMDDNEPSAENKWQWVRIGDKAVFRKAASCTLSDITTFEGDARENLLTEFKKKSLSKSYSNPNLGLRLCLRQAGAIKANDVIYVEDV